MGTQESGDLVRFLVELEQTFDPERAIGVDPDQLIRYALTIRASDYWPNKALDWLAGGYPIGPVERDLRMLIDDQSRRQPLRHQALRTLNGRG